MNKNKLDQFYTNPKVSDTLVQKVLSMFPDSREREREREREFLEPSAGSGNFIDSLIKFNIDRKNIKAYDIEPKAEGIIKANYLEKKIRYKKERIIIGNPPFGKRASLAIEFVNKGLLEADVVAMILPKTLTRYSAQNKITKNSQLIFSEEVDEDAFLINDRRYHVSCVFQIWTRPSYKTFLPNQRILTRPPIRHNDFQTWIHNNTKETLKYFNKEKFGWDFAVHRQGWYSYNELITDPKKLIKNRQYIFIKANNTKIKKILQKIDFEKLSKSNTQTPGFSTTDLVKEYKDIIGDDNE